VMKFVIPATECWSDGGGAFQFLEGAGFPHSTVIHRQREFSKITIADGQAKLISTNAAEGLFGLVKTWLRGRNVKAMQRDAYGPWLAEFLWRLQNCSTAALGVERESSRVEFWELCRCVSAVNKPSMSWGGEDSSFRGEWDFTVTDPETCEYFALAFSRDQFPVPKRKHTRAARPAAGEQPPQAAAVGEVVPALADGEQGAQAPAAGEEVGDQGEPGTPESPAPNFVFDLEDVAFSGDEVPGGLDFEELLEEAEAREQDVPFAQQTSWGSAAEATAAAAVAQERLNQRLLARSLAQQEEAVEEAEGAVEQEEAVEEPEGVAGPVAVAAVRRQRTQPLVEVLGVPNKPGHFKGT
jgi:hypothetical protein